jgi:hypothetical protein
MLGMFIVWLIRRLGGAVALPEISGQTFGIIIGGIVLIALMATSTLPWQTWLTIAGAGAIAYAFRASMLGRVAAGILLTFGVGYGLFHGVYGDEAGKVAEANRKALAEAATKASSPTTPTSKQAQQAAPAVPAETVPAGTGTRKTRANEEGTFPFVWQLTPDGTIPAGQESEPVRVPINCKTDMPIAHDGPDFEIWLQPQFTRKWMKHDGKARYSASLIKIKSLTEGNVPFTYTVSECK